MQHDPPRVVLAITGASGSPIALRLLQKLLQARCKVHLTISPSGAAVLKQELGLDLSLHDFEWKQLMELPSGRHRAAWIEDLFTTDASPTDHAVYHHYQDFSAGIASGSFRTAGMVICPCSMGTLAAVAQGMSTNLIQRAADVHLKERRPLIVMPRETPLSLIHIENMRKLTQAGGVVLPAMPAWYHQPQGVLDLIDSVVQRICDHLGVDISLMQRWGEQNPDPPESR